MRTKKFFIVGSSICVIIGLVSVYLYFHTFLAKPLGPSLSDDLARQLTSDFNQLPTSDQLTTPVPITQQLSQLTQHLSQQLSQQFTQQPTQQPPLCGNTPVLTILVVGLDDGGDNYSYGNADVIRIVRVDFTKPKVTVFSLDRDIWVEIPGIEAHYGITHGKLNSAYAYGVPDMGYYDGTAGGAGLLAVTLKKNFDLNLNNYVVVSMPAFVKMVDALGGIDVYLSEPIDGSFIDAEVPSLGYFNAGTNHLDGTQALHLAQIRDKYSELIRFTNQDAIIKGLTDKISSPGIILKIPEILRILKGTVLTDLSPNQINIMVCLIRKMDKSDLGFAEIPQSYYTQSTIYDPNTKQDTFIWDIDFNIIRSYVSEFQSGRWP